MLVLGASFFIMSIAIMENGSGPYIYISLTIPPGFLQGALVGSSTRGLLINGSLCLMESDFIL